MDYTFIPLIPEKKEKIVHCKRQKYDVYIGRGNNCKWGNPFTHINDHKTLAKFIVSDRNAAIDAYEKWITEGEGMYLLNDLRELKGKILGCWCSPQRCHGEILLKLINIYCL